MITELLLRQLKQDGCYIQFIQEATEEMQLIAVQQNYLALQYNAVRQNGLALQFVEHKTDAIIKMALLQNTQAFDFI